MKNKKLFQDAERLHGNLCEAFKARYQSLVNEHYCELAWELADNKVVSDAELVALSKAIVAAAKVMTTLDELAYGKEKK
jgi:UDP-N-acetylglucosamine transferase subunit ALG13